MLKMETETTKVDSEKRSRTTFVVILFFVLTLIFTILLAVVLLVPRLPCRGSQGSPSYTGISSPDSFENGTKDFSTIFVDTCLLDVDVVSDTEVNIKIGFFENYWMPKKYSAKLGGKEPKVAVCNGIVQGECELVEARDLVNKLETGDVYSMYLVTTDSEYQLIEADSDYVDFMDRLKTSILNVKDFPRADQIIQVSQVDL